MLQYTLAANETEHVSFLEIYYPENPVVTDRGKALATASHHSVPALQHIHQHVALGPFQAYVAEGCAARGTRWRAALTR